MSYRMLLCVLALLSAAASAETITVDAGANRRPIDPRIYGVNNAAQSQVGDLNVTINRQGGNNTSRYNWLLNADNRVKDYYFESIAYPSDVAGEHGDTHISGTKAAGAEPMITIPMLDWVAKVTPARDTLSSFSVAKYGPQQDADPDHPDFGNGLHANGSPVVNNDPNDANVASDPNFQGNWISHMIGKFNTAANGGVRYYMLDNEPGIWHEDHRDIHPTGAMMTEVRDRMINFATKIKSLDSGATVIGPEEWNYEGYFFSGYDEQYRAAHGFNNAPDKMAHGNMDYLPWLLDQLHQKEISGGTRLLDIFSVHYYPQDRGDNGVVFSDDVTPAVRARRNRATRSLWDPNYLDESYLGDNGEKIDLIPRLKGWVNQYYPNTLVAVNEYSFGAEGHINGATAQADALGIFGREGLDMACRWEVPATGSPAYNAIKMYRNYDGAKSTFGDMSVKADVTQPDNLAAFAAMRSASGELTVMVINKIAADTPVSINLANFTPGATAQVWQLTAANTITQLAGVNIANATLTTTVPMQSITLFVIPASSGSAGNSAPVIQSPATALPTTALVGQAVNFTVAASDADGDMLTYLWNFGDGLTASTAQATHSYSVAGNYAASVSVADGKGGMAFSSVTVIVTLLDGSGSGGSGNGGGGDAGVAALTINKLQSSVFFNVQGKDTLTFSGMLTGLPSGFTASGKTLTVSLNGTLLPFTLDAKGKGSAAGGSVTLQLKGKRDPQTRMLLFPGGSAPVSIRLKGTNLSDAFGIDATTENGPQDEHLEVILDGVTHAVDFTPNYKAAKNGTSGKLSR